MLEWKTERRLEKKDAEISIRSLLLNMGIIEKIFGTHSENELKRIYPIVDRIEKLEPDMIWWWQLVLCP